MLSNVTNMIVAPKTPKERLKDPQRATQKHKMAAFGLKSHFA